MKSIRSYQREIRILKRRIAVLEERLYGLAPEMFPLTLDQDMKRGMTINVRIPKSFMVRD